MIAAFPDATPTTIDAGELGREKQPGVEECVKWFYELLREHAGGTFRREAGRWGCMTYCRAALIRRCTAGPTAA